MMYGSLKSMRNLALALAAALTAIAPGVQAQPAPIKIGTVLSTTGPAAFLGDPTLKTLQLYVERLNAQGGLLGRPLQLISYDDASDANNANTLMRRLTDSDQVDLVIGGSTTGSSMAMVPIAEKAGVPFIALGAAVVIVEPVKKWVFKIPHSDRQVAARLFEDMKKRGISKLGLLTDTSGFGQSGRKELQLMAPKYGVAIVSDETYGPRDNDMTPQLTKISNTSGVQAILIFGFGQGTAVATKNFGQLGIKSTLYLSHGSASEEYIRLSGKSAEGALIPAAAFLVPAVLGAGDPQKPVAEGYHQLYKQRYKEEVSAFGGNAYDALLLAVESIKRAGSLDKEKVRTALEQTSGVVGLNGVFNMSAQDHNGLSVFSLRMLRVKNNRFVGAD
jgi:branched-chain amino acid transport system substrate-binding protein